MPILDADMPTLTVLLSPERLGVLTKLTGSIRTAIELHQDTLRLGATLMNLTACIEIALRNAICENLGQFFGVPRWLLEPPNPFQWRLPEQDHVRKALDSARRAEYSKLSQAQKAALETLALPKGRPDHPSHLMRAQARRQHIVVTEGKVVAELTLYFWKRLYSSDYEQTLWKTSPEENVS
ncbi:MAG: hypothetical protein JO196_01450 [Hyphomicrobiales bacterium]|nr:hypothetical protein [Hyphomicrobiales bacterium]